MTSHSAGQATAGTRPDTPELTRLIEGNNRFVAGTPSRPHQDLDRRQSLVAGQQPFAAILSCADSRVSPELAFDQGLGDLFVIRTAGQVVDRAVLGTIQYAVAELKVPLLLVLGHTSCGAVKATLAAHKGAAPTGTAIDALIAAIGPATTEAHTEADPLSAAVESNVAQIVAQLRAAPVLAGALDAGNLDIRGAVYDLSSGRVILV
jgi:carbonic anhydrase